MVLLYSTENEGAFYVETKNLDGETNLKLKNVAKDLIEPFNDIENLQESKGLKKASLNIEEPNNRIYKFDGYYEYITPGRSIL